MDSVNQIVICRDNYNSANEFKTAIADATMLLLNNDYIMTIRYDEKGLGIVVIEFDYNDMSFGGLYPYWMTQDEYFKIND
jgi:hypothetical protein